MDITIRDQAQNATRPPVIMPPDASLQTVARRMWEAGVGAAVVVDDDHPLGIISERDIVGRIAQGSDLDTTTAEQVMTPTIASARPDDRVLEVIFLMTDSGIRHVPVIDEHGRVEGMVSIRDLLRPLLVANLGG
jgi:CBS domain-containing protein